MARGSPTPTVGGLGSKCGRGPISSWCRWSSSYSSTSPVESQMSPGTRTAGATPHLGTVSTTRLLAPPYHLLGACLHPGFERGQSISSESLCQQQQRAHSAAGRPPIRASGVTGQGIPVDSGDRRPLVAPLGPHREILCW